MLIWCRSYHGFSLLTCCNSYHGISMLIWCSWYHGVPCWYGVFLTLVSLCRHSVVYTMVSLCWPSVVHNMVSLCWLCAVYTMVSLCWPGEVHTMVSLCWPGVVPTIVSLCWPGCKWYNHDKEGGVVVRTPKLSRTNYVTGVMSSPQEKIMNLPKLPGKHWAALKVCWKILDFKMHCNFGPDFEILRAVFKHPPRIVRRGRASSYASSVMTQLLEKPLNNCDMERNKLNHKW